MLNFKNENHAIRVMVVMLLSLAMLLATVSVAFAKGSINDDTNKPVVPGSGEWTGDGFEYYDDWEGIISTDVDPDKYEDRDVADLIDDVNNGEDIDFQDMIDRTHQPDGKTDPSKFPTTDGYDVDLGMYDRITDFYELRYHKDGVNQGAKPGEVTIYVPEAKGMDGGDLLILIIDPKTGEIFLVPPTKFNSLLGVMTVDFPCIGPYCILHKIPLVVRNVDPDRYPNKELAEIIRNMPYNEVIGCSEFLKALGADPSDSLEVAEGVTVNTEDYSAAIALSDVAVELSRTDFSYNLSSKFRANLYRGNDKVDWERILKYAGVDYDKSKIKEDDNNLTEFEPIKLEDCFVYHVDAVTMEPSIIYEPTVCWAKFEDLNKIEEQLIEKDDILYWDVDDIDEQNVKDRKLNIEDEEETSSILADEVYAAETVDETYNNDEDVCIVINGDEYLGMGPFLLFMPNNPHGFPWWILLMIAAAGGGCYVYGKNRKKKDDEQTA